MRYRKRLLLISSLIILLPILIGGIAWNTFPEAAGHWTSRAMNVLGIPLFILLVHWVLIIFTAAGKKQKFSDLLLWICPVLSWIINAVYYILYL